MRKILIAVDLQKDFIDGSLGTKEARAIIPACVEKMKNWDRENVYATRDTHPDNYLETFEGRHLPVEHCIEGTEGWQLNKDIAPYVAPDHIIDKPGFGSLKLADLMKNINQIDPVEIELIGLCTDICVVSNALLLKAYLPDTVIKVDSSCCAGVTPELHEAALATMRSCQIEVY